MDNNSVPPGFAPRTSFKLKKAEASAAGVGESDRSNAVVDSLKQVPTQIDSVSELTALEKVKTFLQKRPWLVFDQTDSTSAQPVPQQVQAEPPKKASLSNRVTRKRPESKSCVKEPRLPKGVTRGSPESGYPVKLTERWHPEGAIIEQLDKAPVFYPTQEEFKDTLQYISSISARAAQYGICCISPPPSWKPPFLNEENSIWKSSTFAPHIEQIDGLRSNLDGPDESRKKKRRISKVGLDRGFEYISSVGEVGQSDVNCFESKPGPKFTLDSYKRYADDFKHQYFRKSDFVGNQCEPSVENIEAEYTRIVQNPTDEIEVLCGNYLDTKGLGSGFPVVSNDTPECLQSGWNLNNLPKLPGSLLSFESHDTCNILVPQTRVGMCFSTSLWRVEEHHLYSLYYNHLGAPKVWYGVPGNSRIRFEAAKRNSFQDSSKLHSLVKQISPSALKSEEIPIYHCIQRPGEFVLVFPGAYHSEFDCGFNFTESACFAPIDWLPEGQSAVELYSEQERKTSISYDKQLLGAAREAVRAQWEISLLKSKTPDNLRWRSVCLKGILTEVFKSRLKSEDVRRKYFCTSLKSERMNSDFDSTTKRECSICFCDLHFSVVGCPCSIDRYACLFHAKQSCRCDWSNKFFRYRHEIKELNVLVEALEGKLGSIIKWAKEDLGLYLHEHLPKSSAQLPGLPGPADISNTLADKTKLKEYISEDASSPVTTSSITAELKARMLQSSISKTLKGNDNPLDAAAAKGNGTSSDLSVRIEQKIQEIEARQLKSTVPDDEHSGVSTPQQPEETGGTPSLPIEVASDVSSVTSSESSSESDDIIPDLGNSLEATHQAESKGPQDRILVLSDDDSDA